jgi:hypothetical protein
VSGARLSEVPSRVAIRVRLRPHYAVRRLVEFFLGSLR